MEEVVAGQLPHMLTQPIVILAHGALQPRANVLLSHRHGGEGLDFLFVCGWGTRVFKLIEELKDKEAREQVGWWGPSPHGAMKCKAGLPAKAPRPRLSWPDPERSEVSCPRRPSPGLLPTLLLITTL